MYNCAGLSQIRIFHAHQLGKEKKAIEQTRASAIVLNRASITLIKTGVQATMVLTAMAGIYAKTRQNLEATELIDRIRKE